MRKTKRLFPFSNSERGQSIILIAGAFIGLVAFMGLAIDTGILFIGYGHLRRATDAAALAAAQQFRTQYTSQANLDAELDASATEFLRLNNVDLDNVSATVQSCSGLGVHHDASLCSTGTAPKRKLVRVLSTSKVKFVFLNMIGIYDATVTASSEGEAAALDVVLAIDISESMTYDCPIAGPCHDENGNTLAAPEYRDASYCNAQDPTGSADTVDPTPGECHPFEEIKKSAKDLARFILDKPSGQEEDRLSIVVFSNGWEAHSGNSDPRGTYILTTASGDGWTSNLNEALDLINNLKVYTPNHQCLGSDYASTQIENSTYDPNNIYAGICLTYNTIGDPHTFLGTPCPSLIAHSNVNPSYNIGDDSTCGTTNLGGGLKLGALQFGSNARSESLWVEIVLTDGMPNATCNDSPSSTTLCPPFTDPGSGATLDSMTHGVALKGFLPINYCPDPLNTYAWWHYDATKRHKYCLNDSPTVIHSIGDPGFNPMDYTRIAALFAACDPVTPSAACNAGLGGRKGQGAVVFAIGMGKEVAYRDPDHTDNSYPAFGDYILRYIAAVGDDGNPATDPCASYAYPDMNNPVGYECGNYFYAASGSELANVFTKIENRIFTRISK
jgi:Flp pilus assembly protein TadG